MIPGEYMISDEPVAANEGADATTLEVRNTGDRPIQVGSHTHFFEVNKALDFERGRAYGCHLNIPAGTSIRFEPGDARMVQVTPFGGYRRVYGLSGLVNGDLDENRQAALQRARERGFRGA